MDYEKQRAFLKMQDWRSLFGVVGCGILMDMILDREILRTSDPPWTQPLALALAIGLLWCAFHLPNYLCLSAVAWRRLRWVARARWFLGGLMLMVSVASQAWTAAAVALLLLATHLPLGRRLVHALPTDPEAARGKRVALGALVYGVMELTWLWVGARGNLSPSLLVEFLFAFLFLSAVLVRPRGLLSRLVWAIGATAVGHGLTGAALPDLAVCLWAYGTTSMLARADLQNEENSRSLVEKLQTFSRKPRETVVSLLAESTARLAEDWNRTQPQGAAEIAAWYSRNARYYLYDVAQHHLHYNHITYTLGLLALARRCAPGGRVLDFGGGNGDFSCALAKAGFDTTYLDVPGQAAEFARWRAEHEGLRFGIAHDAATLAGPFDMVFSLDVLEHLVEVKPTLERWAALLRPGGWLVFTYYTGATSSGPMHIDPGFDVPGYLVAQGFRNIKRRHVGLFSPTYGAGLFSPVYLRNKQFVVLEKRAS